MGRHTLPGWVNGCKGPYVGLIGIVLSGLYMGSANFEHKRVFLEASVGEIVVECFPVCPSVNWRESYIPFPQIPPVTDFL